MARAFVALLVLSACLVDVSLSATMKADSKIKHIVILMQENRSFDHFLGFLKRQNAEINGLNGNETQPLSTSDPFSPVYTVSDDSGYVTDPDPGHGVSAVTEQAFGSYDADDTVDPAPMNGFVQNYERLIPGDGKAIMRQFAPESLPVSTALANEFAVFDDWFCGMPGPTMPNRYYLLSATSNGVADNAALPIIVGFPQKTIFELIEDAGLDWTSYFAEAPTPLAFKGTRKVGNRERFWHISKFAEHVAEGRLATLTHIDPLYYGTPNFPPNDDHPDHDVRLGQLLFKEIYETLRASPMWENTLFIITYDEHGGFYDHVPTPINVPNPDGIISQEPYCEFTRLGPRVPTIMASPWIQRGHVEHRAKGPHADSRYDHSSVAATIRAMFDLPEPLTRRDAWSGTFNHVWANRTTPRTDTPLTLPDPPVLPGMRKITGREPASGLQQELALLAAGLNNDMDVDVTKMTVIQAAAYVQRQVNKFFGRQMYPESELWDNYCKGRDMATECSYAAAE